MLFLQLICCHQCGSPQLRANVCLWPQRGADAVVTGERFPAEAAPERKDRSPVPPEEGDSEPSHAIWWGRPPGSETVWPWV